MAESAADQLLPPPPSGRVWRGARRVRFGDVDPAGRARLDALGTYIQDLASDDTADAGLGGDMVWVVRRAVIEVHRGPRFLEDLELETWCAGLGRRWAERRVTMRGARGALVEAAMLWVSLDHDSGRPLPLTADFVALYGEAAAGREVSARLQHRPEPPPGAVTERRPWPLRATDFDLLDHVNNAAAWAMVEEVVAPDGPTGPFRAEIEYRVPVERGYEVELDAVRTGPGAAELWAIGRAAPATGAGREPVGAAAPVLCTTARIFPLPG
jgi:acyl-ACP thioesterase